MKIISSEAGERLARAKRELDSSQEEFERLDKKEFRSEEEKIRWALRGRKELREPVAVATQEFYRAAEVVASELVARGFGNAEGD